MAIAFDFANHGQWSSGTSFSYSHTCTGTKLILWVAVNTGTNNIVSGVTYNGVSMTQVGTTQDSGGAGHEFTSLWYLLAPSTGSNTVLVSMSGTPSSDAGSTSASYTGAAQSGIPDSTNQGGTAAATSLTTATTVVANNSWVVCGSTNNNGSGSTAGSGSTKRSGDAGKGIYDSNGGQPAGSYSMTVNTVSTASMSQVMASFAPYIDPNSIAYDTNSSGQVSSGVTTLTYSHNCATNGVNGLLTVFVDYLAADRTITGVTYNGVAMIPIYNQVYNAAREHGYFYLVNPAKGANNVVVTMSGSTSQQIMAQSLSYTGVAQTGTILDANNANTSTGSSVSTRTVSVTTTKDKDWLVGYYYTGGTVTAGANTTLRGSFSGLPEEVQGYDTNGPQSPAGSYGLTINISPNNTQLAMYIAAFAPAVVSTNGNFLGFM